MTCDCVSIQLQRVVLLVSSVALYEMLYVYELRCTRHSGRKLRMVHLSQLGLTGEVILLGRLGL